MIPLFHIGKLNLPQYWMAQRIEVEGYHNYKGELQLGLRFTPTQGYSRILTRSEAMALREQLNAALAISDRVDTDSEAEAHARMTNAMNRGR